MPVVIEPSAPTELSLADLQPRGEVYPSPVSWRDQILYFLLPDRFSDGGEAQRPLFDRGDPAHARKLYVLLDVIYNHTGNNWFYDQDGVPRETRPYRFHPPYPFHGWRSETGQSTASIAGLEDGAWPARLIGMVKSGEDPAGFFGQFLGHDSLGSHRETGRYHVSILDDHDMVGCGKHRFAAHNTIPNRYQQVAHAVGTQLTTLGMPCLYYGTEQALDGTQDRHDYSIEPELSFEDRYIRESMFGGTFGAFETAVCHFFDPAHPTYLRIAAISRIRNRGDQLGLALCRGRQYLRETSFLDRPFAIPGQGEVIAWSRLFHHQEVLVAFNSHGTADRGAYVTVEAALHPHGSAMTFLYRGTWSDEQLRQPPNGHTVPVEHHSSGRATVRLDLPPAGMTILA